MSLDPGSVLGPYEITGKLGAGGMGEVYRARDTKLDREVALKVLPEAFSSDPERLARFEREAKVLASLNHPHIGHIYGLEEADGVKALVLELVEGPTLADRIAEGPIPLEEALPIARQIAEALEAAHEQGIIHRDLKPANIKLRPDGTVKVLDFGLAKALQAPPGPDDPSVSQSPTMTAGATELGVILGTSTYMAPEQARGQPVDRRADIWAFGCVLYEMLTGERPFVGEGVSDTLAAVLRSEPDWETLPRETPGTVRRILRRCLDRDLRRRLQHIGDARIEIEETLEPGEEHPVDAEGRTVTAPARWRLVLSVLALAVLGGALWRWAADPPAPAAAVLRFPIGVPAGSEMVLDEPAGVHLAVAPDGSRVAFAAISDGSRHLLVRAMDELDARHLPGTEGAQQPFFDPDGEWIGFLTDNQLMKVSVAGGSPVLIAETKSVVGASWGSDDRIVLGQFEGGLLGVPASGGRTTVVTTVDSEAGDRWHVFPQILPGGDRVLYIVKGEPDRVEIAPLAGGEPLVVLTGSRAAKVFASGHLVYPEAAGLMAAPFDLSTAEVTGAASLVVESVFTKSTVGVNNAAFSVSSTGALAYQPGVLRQRLAWLDVDGSVEVLPDARWGYWYTDVSPADGRVATTVAIEAAVTDVWVLGDGPPVRVTTDQKSLAPRWTRDGERVAFTKATGGSNLHWQRPGSQEPEELLLDRPGMQFPGSFSPDDARLAFFEKRADSGQDIRELILESREVRDLVVTPFNEAQPEYSPDGRWLSFSSDRSGEREIWVMRLPDGAPRQVTRGGGSVARWSPDGNKLVYSDGVRLWQLELSTGGLPDPATARALPDGRYLLGTGDFGSSMFAVAPDGRAVVSIIEEQDRQPMVVWNWLSELERLVPVDR